MEGKELVTRRDTSVMSQAQAMYLLKTIWKDAPDTEVIKAGILCRQYNLNPLMGHVFLVKYDRYTGRGDQRHKVGEDWAIVRGIKAKRAMAQAKHRFSYADGPRVMTDDEQVKIFGEVEKDKIWAFVLLRDGKGNEYPGYGFWTRESGVYGSDKGNSPRNMAFIRAESNALDKLEPGELPSMDVADESFIVGDFQSALEEGKQELIENAEQDAKELWPEGGTKPQPQSKGEYAEKPQVQTPQDAPGLTLVGGSETISSTPQKEDETRLETVLCLEWVKESLRAIPWSGVLGWIRVHFKIQADTVREAIEKMTDEQKHQFGKEIKDRLKMADKYP